MLSPITGLITPFRSNKAGGFVRGSGPDLQESKLRQIIMTDPGELPWRTRFGSGIDLLRFQSAELIAEVARTRLIRAFAAWAPNVSVISVSGEALGTAVFLKIVYSASGVTREVDIRFQS